jgi:CARDB
MKRWLVIAGSLAAVAVPAPAIGLPAAGSPAAGASAGKATLQGFHCITALDPSARAMTVSSVMRPLAHTVRMAVRFDLLESSKRDGPVTTVRYGDLGKWKSIADQPRGQRPITKWIVNKQVRDLAAAYFRFRVSFRWTGSHGKVLGSAVRASDVCFQPERRPDLQVKAIAVKLRHRHPHTDLYVGLITNNGDTASGPFEVEFVDGTSEKPKPVASLGPHAKTRVSFIGPLCDASAPPSITADSADQVDDFNRANNTLTATCPVS